MPKLNNFAHQQANSQQTFANNAQNQAQFQEQNNQQQPNQQKGLFSLPPSLMQIVP
jgi:hypothetical protein